MWLGETANHSLQLQHTANYDWLSANHSLAVSQNGLNWYALLNRN